MDARQSFLDAWEAAGRPPVKKTTYPQHGEGSTKVLFSHSDIRLWADSLDATFKDDGVIVKLWWTYAPQALDLSGGTTELYFDRENPIQVGRSAD